MNTTTSDSSRIFRIGGDLPVTRIGLGTMRLTNASARHRPAAEAEIWNAEEDRSATIAFLRAAVELGVDLLDTADSYGLGDGETQIAEALAPYPPGLVVATKVGIARPSPTEWVPLGHPAYLRQQAELGLRRLRVERIDLLQLHRVDPAFPLEEQVGALAQLQTEGKVRHIGLSEVTAEQLTAALAVAPIAAVQNLYNLAERGSDPVVDLAAERGIAFIPFFPVAMGAHTGQDSPVAAIAREIGATPAQVALAWLLHRSPTIVPIPGTSSAGHVRENLGALDIALTAEQFARLGAFGRTDHAA
ncbi:aldo/keto reductase [Pseudonocardia kunmingensis]|uniref:Aryl-alcohol dehydrogenase-like predicted oxidoreductase n=1 Tax=Pseudonocardia kunmingensis TaxID=630975 RepID=A0A543DZV8_9PSEU|nr:aldo/keto reductase [Pseudonocardia kunmingensis]TQM14865.1 aryl-alcohol dehydrogenase-like predicted oxidoreductase [Pseudonocardia kunmingensis]